MYTRGMLDENTFQAMLDHMPGGIVVCLNDPGLTVEYINDEMLHMLGCPGEQNRQGGRYLELVHPDDRQMLKEAIKRASTEKKSCKFRVFNNNGEIVWLSDSFRLLKAPDGRELVLNACDDITDDVQKHNEYSALIEKLPGGISHHRLIDGLFVPVAVNEGFARMVGLTTQEQYEELKADCLKKVHPSDKPGLFAKLRSLTPESEDVSYVYRLLNRKTNQYFWVRSDGVVEPRPDGTMDMYVSYTDVDADVKNRQMLTSIIRCLGILDNVEDFPRAINLTLNEIRDYFNAARSYIFDIDYDNATVSNSYEVCAPGVSAEIDRLQNLPLQSVSTWLELFQTSEFIHVDVSSLDESRSLERSILESQHIRELMSVPIMAGGEIVGFVGVDDPRRNHENINFLVSMAGFISNSIIKDAMSRSIKNSEAELRTMVKNTPGGLLTCRARGDKLALEYVNENFSAMLGYDLQDLSGMLEGKTLITDPEDSRALREFCLDSFAHRRPDNYTCRFKKKDGGYVTINLQLTYVDEGDSVLIYALFIDISKEMEAIEREKELWDSLRAAITHMGFDYWDYFPDRDEFILYTNSRCPAPTNQIVTGYPWNWMDGEMVHPDHGQRFVDMILEVKNGADTVADDFLILYDDGDYHWERIQFTTIRRSDGSRIKAVGTAFNIDELMDLTSRFNTTLNQSRILTWELDVNSRTLTYYNEDLARAFGQPRVLENVPECFLENGYLHPGDYAQVEAMFNDLYSGKAQSQCTGRWLLTGEEQPCWFQAKYDNIFDSGGRVYKAIGSFADITEQKVAEARYTQNLAYRSLAQKSSIASFHLNLSRNTLEDAVSEREELRALGEIPSADLLFQSLYTHIPKGEQYESFIKTFSRARLLEDFSHGRSHIELEHLLQLDKPSEIWIKTYADIALNPTTGDVEAFIYAHDIDSQRKMDRLVQNVVAVAYDMLALVDVHTNRIQIFTSKDDLVSAFTHWEYYNEEMVHMLDEYVHPDDRERMHKTVVLPAVIEALSKSEKHQVFYRMYENGRLRHKNMTCVYLDERKNHVIFFRSDVTAAVEEQERYRQAAEAANMAKSDFLSQMSHDMRTPLNGIIGLTNIALMEQDPELTKEYLAQIATSGNFLLGLINDVLDMAKIESGRMELNPEIYTYSEFIRYINAVFLPQSKEKNLKFVLEEVSASKTIWVDKLRLNQILFNLLANAVKFTPEGGEFGLKMELLSSNEQEANIRFVVWDTGIGMGEDFVKIACEPFSREDNGMSAQSQGTGLGLSIVKNLCDMMNGKMELHSVKGQGTTVTLDFCFPLTNAGEEPETSEKKEPSLEGRRILLAEDHPMNVLVATKLLERVGAKVERAENGKVALEMFQNSKPGYYDAVLMDVRMPEMDGLEATCQMRALNKEDSASIPIIAMTANVFNEDVERSLAAGMNAHLGKPIEPEKLYQTLLEHIEAR